MNARLDCQRMACWTPSQQALLHPRPLPTRPKGSHACALHVALRQHRWTPSHPCWTPSPPRRAQLQIRWTPSHWTPSHLRLTPQPLRWTPLHLCRTASQLRCAGVSCGLTAAWWQGPSGSAPSGSALVSWAAEHLTGLPFPSVGVRPDPPPSTPCLGPSTQGVIRRRCTKSSLGVQVKNMHE